MLWPKSCLEKHGGKPTQEPKPKSHRDLIEKKKKIHPLSPPGWLLPRAARGDNSNSQVCAYTLYRLYVFYNNNSIRSSCGSIIFQITFPDRLRSGRLYIILSMYSISHNVLCTARVQNNNFEQRAKKKKQCTKIVIFVFFSEQAMKIIVM